MGLMMKSIKQGWSSASGVACEALLWEHASLYLTVWDSSRCHCSDFNVITQLVGPTIQPWRSAQAFVLSAEGIPNEAIDIINIHSPSSDKHNLSDTTRKTIVETLLQSRSIVNPTRMRCQSRCIIGGDLNTDVPLFTTILDELNLIPHDNESKFLTSRDPPLHGDVALSVGVAAQSEPVNSGVYNPVDNQHDPVIVKIQMQLPSHQRVSSEMDTSGHHTTATAVANPTSFSDALQVSTRRTPSGYASATAHDHDGPLPVRRQSQTKPSTSSNINTEIAKAATATERGHDPMAVQTDTNAPLPIGDVSHQSMYLQTVDAPTSTEDDRGAVPNNTQPNSLCDQEGLQLEYLEEPEDRSWAELLYLEELEDEVADSTQPVATERRVRKHEELYASVSLFLWNANLHSESIEEVIEQTILERNESQMKISSSLETIFHPFFFSPRAQTSWTPKGATAILDKLAWYAKFREPVLRQRATSVGPATELVILTEAEVSQCYGLYLRWFWDHEATAAQKKAKNLRNIAGARMHSDIGNKYAAFAVWEVGLPQNLSTRFEQHNRTQLELQAKHTGGSELLPYHGGKNSIPQALLQSMLSEEGQGLLKEHIGEVLLWLEMVANAIQQKKQTAEYAAQQQRPGGKNQSPLTFEEQQMQNRERKLHSDIRAGKALYSRWDATAGWTAFTPAEQTILWAYWKGDLQRELQQLSKQPREKGPKRLDAFRVSG